MACEGSFAHQLPEKSEKAAGGDQGSGPMAAGGQSQLNLGLEANHGSFRAVTARGAVQPETARGFSGVAWERPSSGPRR